MKRFVRKFARSAIILAGSVLVIGLSVVGSDRAAAQNDLSGIWNGSYSLTCIADVDQSGNDLSVTVDCGGDLTGTLEGTLDPATSTVTLTGTFVEVPVELAGTVSPDGTSLSGTWTTLTVVPVERPFSGTREDAAPDSTDLTGRWIISVGEYFAGSCEMVIEHSGTYLAATMECEDLPSTALEGVFDASTGAISLSGPFLPFTQFIVEATVAADGSSFSGTWTVDPIGPSGKLNASRKTPAGDVSCDSLVDSIDAALVLQRSAGLIDSLPCQDTADVNGDGDINAIDATLILQFVAGLLPGLPV